MAKSLRIGVGVLLVVTGCATQAQFLDGKQAMAMRTAVSRGQFEMNCPAATGTIISREVVQPALQGPFVIIMGSSGPSTRSGWRAARSARSSSSSVRTGGKDVSPRVRAGFTIGNDDSPGRYPGRRAPPELTVPGTKGV